MFKAIKLLSMRVNVVSLSAMMYWIENQCKNTHGSYVCVSNVHMCMECYDCDDFNQVVNNANVIVPDGLPLVWAQKLLGEKQALQVRGMDLVIKTCELAADNGIKVGFYGGTTETLKLLNNELSSSFKTLDICCLIAPPFHALSAEEDSAYIKQINESGAQIMFVGIGCPKQEYWMSEHKEALSCVMLGVGAAFDFIAGQKKHAPKWMQRAGFEWLFRLVSEPCRLWRRYLKHNPRFIYYYTCQLLGRNFDKNN